MWQCPFETLLLNDRNLEHGLRYVSFPVLAQKGSIEPRLRVLFYDPDTMLRIQCIYFGACETVFLLYNK